MLRSMRRVVDAVFAVLHTLSGIVTGLFLILLVIQVIMRYVFSYPIYGLDETVIAMMVWTMSIGFVVVYWENEHAIIVWLLKHLPSWCRRAVNILTSLVALAASLVFITGGLTLFKIQVKTIPMGGLPFPRAWYYALPVIVMGALMLFLGAFRLIEFSAGTGEAPPGQTPVEGGVQQL